MVDMTANLGRIVPTPEQVLSVINGDLILAKVVGTGLKALGMDVDTVSQDYGYAVAPARDAVFAALHDSAMMNVKQWAGDEGLAFDGGKMAQFVGVAIRDAWMGAFEPDLDR
jgi:hypothetical protein